MHTEPQDRTGRHYEFEQFAAVRRHLGAPALDPRARQVAYISDMSGQFNLWLQPLGGGWPRQVTVFQENSVRQVCWSPRGDRLIFLADTQGDEQYQVYSLDPSGGWPQRLTQRDDVQYQMGSGCICPEGRRVAYAGNEDNPADMDVYIYDFADRAAQRLSAGGGFYVPMCWSPDGRRLAIIKVLGNTRQEVYVYDCDEQNMQAAFAGSEPAKIFPVAWLPDGTGLLVLSDHGREFQGLAVCRPGRPELEWLATPDREVEGAALSRDGRVLVRVDNDNGVSRLCVTDRERGQELELPPLPRGVIHGLDIDPTGRWLALFLNAATHPNELYIVDLAATQATRLTYSLIGGVREEDLVEPELVHFRAFDGRQIPAFLYRPRGLRPDERCPALLSIHGGPEAQERPEYIYAGLYQYLLSRGIAVLAPNIRGSTGYGKTYQKLIHRNFGGDDLKDIEHAARFLQSLPWVDSDRLGVFGGSYGGFATLSAVTRLPDYWAAAVDIVGPSNLITFVQSVPPTWRRLMADLVGDAEADRALLIARSPITYVDNIRAPLLIIQGANDPRVVKAESDQMVERLKAQGKVVDYLVFADEGHGFTKRSNQLKAWRATAEFLLHHLQKP